VNVLDFQIEVCCRYFGLFGLESILATFLKKLGIFFKSSGHTDYSSNLFITIATELVVTELLLFLLFNFQIVPTFNDQKGNVNSESLVSLFKTLKCVGNSYPEFPFK